MPQTNRPRASIPPRPPSHTIRRVMIEPSLVLRGLPGRWRRIAENPGKCNITCPAEKYNRGRGPDIPHHEVAMTKPERPAVALCGRLCRPQRIGVFGRRGVGKTTLLTMLYREAVGGRLPGLRLAAGDARTA